MTLFDRTFLISTGVTAVICGALIYYFNAKIRDLELALVKQNQVLSSFIANVQQEFRLRASASAMGGSSTMGGVNAMGGAMGGASASTDKETNELASPEALAAVAEIEYKKIVISDNECVSDDDDSDDSVSESNSDNDGSDSDSVSDNDDDDENNKLVICDLPNSESNENSEESDMKVIDMSSLGLTNLNLYALKSEIFTPENISENESDDDESESGSGDESDDDFQHISKSLIEMEVIKLDELPIEEVVVAPAPVVEPVTAPVPAPVPVPVPVPAPTNKYDDLKVDELRKLVVEKGLGQKEEVKKLKKNELLAVLKKHTS